MSALRTINPTKNNPLLCAHYPMHRGAYCPHLIYHATHLADGRRTHSDTQEVVYVSSYLKDKGWAKPKIKSSPYATVCIILLDEHNTPVIRAINLSNPVRGLDYAAHPDYQPRLSLSPHSLLTMPSTEDVFRFATNPEHFFTPEQASILRANLLKRYPSNHENYKLAMAALERRNPNNSFPTLPLPDPINDGKPRYQQIVHTSSANPFIVANFPQLYGVTERHEFWIERRGKAAGPQHEVAYCRIWNKELGRFDERKRMTPAKSTISIMSKDIEPASPQYGLPVFNSVNLESNLTEPETVYEFAVKHYFTDEQRAKLYLYLVSNASPEILSSVQANWATKPVVPPSP